MKLEWMLLANYAEDNKGLLNISGGAWDTIEAKAPVVGPPEIPADQLPKAIISGYLVMRLLFHPSETGRDVALKIIILDADGGEIATATGQGRVEKQATLPPGWMQGMNAIVPLTGVPLPKFGQYSIAVLVDNQHYGDLSFRVEKKY